jgi:hypothetical protein
MSRAKQIQDRALAPKIDLPTTNRFIKNALWAQAKKDAAARKEAEENAASGVSNPESSDAHQTAKKALWKAAHWQARQLTEESASTGMCETVST